MGGKSNKNKSTDRARNYAVEISQQTDPIWKNMLDQAQNFSSPNYTPTQNSVFKWAQQQLGGTTDPQATADTDIYKQLQDLYQPFMGTNYNQNPLYQQSADVYNQGYNQLKDLLAPWQGTNYTEQPLYQQMSGQNNASYQQLSDLYSPWMNTNYQSSPLYTQMNDLYTQQAQPLYGQMLDPLKRNLEGQYQTAMNQIMANSPRGGSMGASMAQAATGRAQGASDLEKQLRTQDILRQDTLDQQRTAALGNVLTGLESTRQQVASQLGQAQQNNNSSLQGVLTGLEGARQAGANTLGQASQINAGNLSNILASLDASRQNATGQLGAGALGINQQQSSNQLSGNQLLTALLGSIYSQDQSMANQLGLYGTNSLQGILNQQSAAGSQASAQGGSDLMSMMSSLGLGAGMLGSSMYNKK